jgi:integrase/recombinase XerD
MNLKLSMASFMDTKRAGNRAQGTLDWYQFMFDAFLFWADERGYSDNDLYQADAIEEYLIDSAAAGQAPASVLGRYRALRALFRWLERRGKLEAEHNPFDLIEEPKAGEKLPKAISYANMQRLSISIEGQDWHAQRDRLIIQFLFYSGVRVSELVCIRLSDVDLERRSIQVHRQKTNTSGFVPIARSLAQELQHWIEEVRPACASDMLFVSSKAPGHPIGPLLRAGVREMLRRRCLAANMKIQWPHAFRHGCAVYIIQRGGDISLVQRVLGHKDMRTSMIYLRFETDKVREMYDKVFA